MPEGTHRAHRKPWSIGLFHASRGPVVEVSLLDDVLESRLLSRAGEEMVRRLEVRSWAEMRERASSRRRHRFRFCTPTGFLHGRTSVPLPIPTQLFGHYRSRWNEFAPEGLRPSISFEEVTLMVSAASISTRAVSVWGGRFIGFTGSVSLAIRSSAAENLSALDALAQIALFSGTGAYTTVGMGVTRCVEP